MSRERSGREPEGDDERGTVLAWRPRQRRAAGRAAALPSPERVFADWLVSIPGGADLAAAARHQIDLIDRRNSGNPDVHYLRTLLLAVAGDCTWRRPVRSL